MIVNIVLIFLIPFVIMRFQSSKFISVLGTVGTAYLAGIIFSLIASVIMPARDTSVTEIIMYICISLAIPLLLFSSNIKRLAQVSKTILLSFGLLILSVIAVAFAFFFLFTRQIDGGEVLSGMAVALYTGGTPNLNAVACFFRLDNTMLLMSNLSDVLFGGVFYVFLIFAAKPLLSKFLISDSGLQGNISSKADDNYEHLRFSLHSPGVVRNLIIALLVTLASLGIGLLIWIAKGQVEGTMVNYVVPALMIGTTIGGVMLSLNDKISSVKENDLMGTYFATVFSYALASIIDLGKISSIYLKVFVVFAVITSAAFILHALLCMIFHIDVNTMIVTATAGIYGPAFIPSICRSIKADELLAPGLITGSLGYAIGTFLGIACTYFLGFLGSITIFVG